MGAEVGFSLSDRRAGEGCAASPRDTLCHIDLLRGGIAGPFTLEASIESEAHQLFFNASLRFAQPNAVVPFSGMEHGDPAVWFATEK